MSSHPGFNMNGCKLGCPYPKPENKSYFVNNQFHTQHDKQVNNKKRTKIDVASFFPIHKQIKQTQFPSGIQISLLVLF